jgi:hypothetical protein
MCGVSMPRVFGFPESFRDAQFDVRQRHDGMGSDHLGGLARELISAFVPGGAGVSLHPN